MSRLQIKLLKLADHLNGGPAINPPTDSELLQYKRELEYAISSKKLPGYREEMALGLLKKVKEKIEVRKQTAEKIENQLTTLNSVKTPNSPMPVTTAPRMGKFIISAN